MVKTLTDMRTNAFVITATVIITNLNMVNSHFYTMYRMSAVFIWE